MPQLSCRNLTLGYEGTAIVSGISFDVNTGDYLSIVGDNGSGKSTLMKTILKLQPPLSGNISTGDGLLASGIGYLPQQTSVQKDFPASVREIVRSGCLNRRGLRPFYSAREKQSADKNMEKLGVAQLAGRCYRELSGGQQQRVLLARALCAAAQIILLDEPTAGLDPKAAGDLYDTIKDLNDGGVTVIMISHDVAASVKYSSHILHIGVGEALYFGTAAEYLTCDAGSGYAALGGD